jgi:hypothetical protein
MKSAKDSLDELVYYLLCIFTLGMVYGARVILTTAIKKAK